MTSLHMPTLRVTGIVRTTTVAWSRVRAASVAAETSNGHSDQADASEGESGQVNVHPLI
jgi:hypothetical protein